MPAESGMRSPTAEPRHRRPGRHDARGLPGVSASRHRCVGVPDQTAASTAIIRAAMAEFDDVVALGAVARPANGWFLITLSLESAPAHGSPSAPKAVSAR